MPDPIDLIRLSSWAKGLLSSSRTSEDPDEDRPSLHGLDLLVVFSGYLDAGNVSTQLENVLLERLDHQRIASVGNGRGNGTHAGDGGQANAQPLIGAAKEYLLHLPLSQKRAVELGGEGCKLHIFGAKQRLDATIGAGWQDVAVYGKV